MMLMLLGIVPERLKAGSQVEIPLADKMGLKRKVRNHMAYRASEPRGVRAPR